MFHKLFMNTHLAYLIAHDQSTIIAHLSERGFRRFTWQFAMPQSLENCGRKVNVFLKNVIAILLQLCSCFAMVFLFNCSVIVIINGSITFILITTDYSVRLLALTLYFRLMFSQPLSQYMTRSRLQTLTCFIRAHHKNSRFLFSLIFLWYKRPSLVVSQEVINLPIL